MKIMFDYNFAVKYLLSYQYSDQFKYLQDKVIGCLDLCLSISTT